MKPIKCQWFVWHLKNTRNLKKYLISQCYIKCYLEGVGILNADGIVQKDRAISMMWPNAAETIEECVEGQSGLFTNGLFSVI